MPHRSSWSSSEIEGVPVWDSDAWRFGGLLARFHLVSLRRGVVSATCEYVRVGSLLVTLGLAAACFSGFFYFRGQGWY